jgi:hypothetical protein
MANAPSHRVVRKAVTTKAAAYSHMLTQYGPLLERLHARLGSWEAVGVHIMAGLGSQPSEEKRSERASSI